MSDDQARLAGTANAVGRPRACAGRRRVPGTRSWRMKQVLRLALAPGRCRWQRRRRCRHSMPAASEAAPRGGSPVWGPASLGVPL